MQSTDRIIRMSAKTIQSLVNYLQARPYAEVAGLIQSILSEDRASMESDKAALVAVPESSSAPQLEIDPASGPELTPPTTRKSRSRKVTEIPENV